MEVPVKVMLDEHRRPFVPFMTSNTIVVDGSDKTVQDMFDERYTKEEVDAIIESLGTLQRLRGRVDTYEELPNDPVAGDTWIVGLITEPNKKEYMWVGNNWEELGPMVDLSGYSTTSEIRTMLSALQSTLETEFGNADINTLNTAKQYTDDKFSNVPTYTAGTNVQINNGVISATDTTYTAGENITIENGVISAEGGQDLPTDLLHYKGHVATEDDLPSLGQSSGTLTTDYKNINNNNIIANGANKNLVRNANDAKNRARYYFYYGGKNPDDTYGSTYTFGVCASSDNPNFLKRIGFAKTSYTPSDKILLYIDASPTYPVYIRGCSGSEELWGTYADVETFNTLTLNSSSLTTLTRPVQITVGYSGDYGNRLEFNSVHNRFIGNIPSVIRFFDNPVGVVNLQKIYTSVKRSTDNYVWTQDMDFIYFGADQIARFVDNSTITKLGDTYTVGTNNDIYYRNEQVQWDIWSKTDLTNYYNKNEVDDAIDAAIGSIVDGDEVAY